MIKKRAIKWEKDDWANSCDFPGNDFKKVSPLRVERCGPNCLTDPKCTHFAWNKQDGGSCYLKDGNINPNQAVFIHDGSVVCGFIKKKLNISVEKSFCHLPPEEGPCEALMPSFFYNSTSNRCEKFNYGGCGGNKNKFKTYRECISICFMKSKNKTEKCPKLPENSAGICVEKCSSDSDCKGDLTVRQKCCSNGCGHVCMSVSF
ncbi:unnamed protein product [Brachionus calyciflorus]|uniref:Uncharacterized protein n=1 Tax=Brachionus calyciflorus TaxID=104777 RepID=A0A814EWI9_9BILA|nr:unnamed protein product [Brachionus calyciflorus]